MTSRYAENTSVSTERSIGEIRSTLQRYGATKFAYMKEEGRFQIAFEMRDRRIKFVLPLPNPSSKQFTHTPVKGDRRAPDKALEAYEQACRQRYRALSLAVKAKLESVEAGIETFEQAFLAHIVLPNNQTVGEWAELQVEQAYLSGKMPPLLMSGE